MLFVPFFKVIVRQLVGEVNVLVLGAELRHTVTLEGV